MNRKRGKTHALMHILPVRHEVTERKWTRKMNRLIMTVIISINESATTKLCTQKRFRKSEKHSILNFKPLVLSFTAVSINLHFRICHFVLKNNIFKPLAKETKQPLHKIHGKLEKQQNKCILNVAFDPLHQKWYLGEATPMPNVPWI